MKDKIKLFGKNNQIIFLCLMLAFGAATANTQNYRKVFDEKKKYHRLQLADSAYRHNFVVLAITPAKIEPDMNKSYTWYIDNTINTTQGNYGGKLLHGLYAKYFIGSNQLATKGEYEHGLRTGNWYEWRENGSLISVIEYQEGKKQGDAAFYDASGNITEKCSFKNDKKSGKSITYTDGKEQTPVKYKDGTVKEKKKPFFKRLLFWKKEKKTEY